MVAAQISRRTAAARSAVDGCAPRRSDISLESDLAQVCDVQPAHCFSPVDGSATPANCAADDTQSWMDGGRICTIAGLYAREYCRGHHPGWIREFRRCRAAGEGRAFFNRTHRALGAESLRAWPLSQASA